MFESVFVCNFLDVTQSIGTKFCFGQIHLRAADVQEPVQILIELTQIAFASLRETLSLGSFDLIREIVPHSAPKRLI
jgi:hypothetical protein